MPGFQHYEVSDFGRVARIRKNGSRRILKTPPDNHGYPRLNLGRGNHKKLHVLVITAFRGSRPPGMEAAHEDGNPMNPVLTNLTWKTHKQNGEDMKRHGSRAGERSGKAKITAADVLTIRCRRREGISVSVLAREYPLSEKQIGRIVSGYSWSHIPDLISGARQTAR